MSKQTFFQDDWLKDPEFNWLASTGNRSQARCTCCRKTFKQATKNHMVGKKHIQCTKSVDHYFFKHSKNDQTKQDHSPADPINCKTMLF